MMNSSQPQLSSLPESDLELLSAYLDNQLSVAERVSLERRLGAEPALRAELEELRETAGALRALEPVRPPRSFTLDPAKVARPRFYFPLTWVMQMGSGLAGMALVLLATVQILGAGAAPGVPMAAKDSPAATEAPAAMAEQAPLATMGPAGTAAPPAAQSAPAPEAAPAADDARRAEATAAPAAAAAQDAAEENPDAAAGTMAMEAPEEPAAQDAPGGAGPAGGAAGGPQSNSPPPGGAGGPPSIDATVDAIQSSGSSSPGTADLPAAPAVAPEPQGFPPGLTLAIGVALIGLGLAWNLRSRRRG